MELERLVQKHRKTRRLLRVHALLDGKEEAAKGLEWATLGLNSNETSKEY